jgi:hypothetical protein
MKRVMVGLAVSLLACEAPPVFSGSDKRQNTLTGRISGKVVVNSAARGKVVLFLYDEARPPPPVGTGRPLTFTVIEKEALFPRAAPGDLGPFTADFALSLVPAGRYLIRGLIDANDDFIPWYGVTADSNRGDVGGGVVDPVTRALRVVEVTTDSAGNPQPALNVAVVFSDAAIVPVDRPTFAIAGDAKTATLTAQPVTLELRSLPINDALIKESAPAFLLRFVDDNGDGQPDDANGDGRPDLWPRVVVRKMADGDSLITDENDRDRNGIIDATGTEYDLATGSKDGKPDAVVLAAGFDPTEYGMQLIDGMGRVKSSPTLVTSLKLVVQPRAFDVSNPLQPQLLRAVPAGRYAITVIQQTGQTWRVPNELAPGQNAVALPEIASQSFVIQVP